MTKEEKRKGLIVILVIALLAAAVVTNDEARQTASSGRTGTGPNDYYSQLENSCDDPCCESSVARMRQYRATVQPSTGCDAGQTANMLRCESSYRWCETPKR